MALEEALSKVWVEILNNPTKQNIVKFKDVSLWAPFSSWLDWAKVTTNIPKNYEFFKMKIILLSNGEWRSL